jgi:hypothetical protein
MSPEQQAARDAALEEAETAAKAVRCEYLMNDGESEMRERIVAAIRALRTTPPPAAPGEITTPAAYWRVEGQPDPHGRRYDCERAALCGGSMSDDVVANAVYLDPSIANLTAAKDRIRWLSRALEAALAGVPRA